MAKNWFIFKGISSEMYNDIIVSELPAITKPKKRSTLTYIDGVDGAVIDENGFDMVTKTLLIGLKSTECIDDILLWLTGSGEFIFSNEPNKVYCGSILNQIDYVRLGRFRTATVTLLCQPYKYLKDEYDYIFLSAGTYSVYNNGTVESLPLISLNGASGVILTNLSDIAPMPFAITLTSFFNKLTADSEVQNVYVTGTSTPKNSLSSGSFIKLQPGLNNIQLSGTFTKITISARSRFL